MSTGLRAAPAQKKVPSRSTYAVLISLTVTTGVIDAASYIGLGHVFTANMTGNIVLLGFGLAGAGHLPVLAPLVSLASFLVGSRIGGVLAARALASGRSRLSPALLCEGTLVLAAAILAATARPRAGSAAGDLVIAALALAMGIRNSTVRKLAVPDMPTTVLTMTLTGLASDSHGRSNRRTQLTRLSCVLAMLGGAVAGGLLVKQQLAGPLWLTAAVALGWRAASAVLWHRDPERGIA